MAKYLGVDVSGVLVPLMHRNAFCICLAFKEFNLRLVRRKRYWVLLKDDKIIIVTRCRKTAIEVGDECD